MPSVSSKESGVITSHIFISCPFTHPTVLAFFFFVPMTCWLAFHLYSSVAFMTFLAETLLSFLPWSVCAIFYLPMTYSPAHHLSAFSPVCQEHVKFPSWLPKRWVSCAHFKTYSVLSFRSFMDKQSSSHSRADLSETLVVSFQCNCEPLVTIYYDAAAL